MITKNKIVKIIELAKKCNECALHYFREFDNKVLSYKDDNSPLTNADVKVNDIAVTGLQKLFPSVEIISEELYNPKVIFNNKNYFWLIDPIDGTKEYIAGKDEYTLNAALVINKVPILGLDGVPKKDRLFFSYAPG